MAGPQARAIAAYVHQFGEDPTAVGYAPGRVNLIGDHTDYNSGLAMPAALQLGCAVAAGPSGDSQITAVAADLNESVRFSADPGQAQIADLPQWAAYAPAAAMETLNQLCRGAATHGLRMAIASDVPIGSGLSSSAALEVAAATAVETLVGVAMDAGDKARLCQSVEHRWAGCPCGLLDQFAAVFARGGHALLIDFASTTVLHVEVPAEVAILLCPTGVRHDNAAGAYDRTRSLCMKAASALGVDHLSMLAPNTVPAKGLLADDQYQAVAHVVSENDRVLRFKEALARREFHLAGRLMLESHESLSRRLRVSCPEVDQLVERLGSITGVFGCRMTGGGCGGFVVALVDATLAAEVMAKSCDMRVGSCLWVTPSGGCRSIEPD